MKQITITLTPKGPNADFDAAREEIVKRVTDCSLGYTYQVTATVSEEAHEGAEVADGGWNGRQYDRATAIAHLERMVKKSRGHRRAALQAKLDALTSRV